MGQLYSIKEETLVAIADNVRAITGTTGELTPGEMTTSSTEISTEVDTQTELIEQIQTALEGKAGGVTLPTLDNPAAATDILSGKEAIDGSGNKITGTIATKTSGNLTANGATVTVPAGYYASQASKSVASGSAKTPATTVTKNPTISVNSSGLITASVSGTQSVTPTVTAGYVSSGTAGTITVSGSATKQLTTQAAQTITPGTSNKTIASGRYLTGTQTIKGDANLVAGNIKSGVSIFGVAGTYADGSEDLSAELTEQANLIAQQQTLISNLETALANKAGGSGGGSVETCDVTIGVWHNSSGLSISRIIYTTVENGKISNKIHVCELKSQGTVTGDVIGLNHEITLSCIVGTSVYMYDENITMPSFVTSDNVTFNGNADDWGLVFEAVIDSGSTATISAEL